jgi:urease accessory protein
VTADDAHELVDGGWRAQLALGFVASDGRCRLDRRQHNGPLRVQRPFYPEGDDLCHVYVLHPPGGIVGGDRLALTVDVGAGARALLTTPAATKVYDSRASAVRSRQTAVLRVAAGASLEWLPQETIVFDGARIDVTTTVALEPGACFAGWDIVCLGRPASNESFARGSYRQRFEIWRGDDPLCIERAQLDGGAPVLGAAWGLGGATTVGTFLCSPSCPELLDDVRALSAPLGAGERASATDLGQVMAVRYLGASGLRARDYFNRVWDRLRPALVGRPSHPPRIWWT